MNDERPELGHYLAGMLTADAPQSARELLRASIRLLCRERALGHVCITLADWADQPSEDFQVTFPKAAEWRKALLSCAACGDGAPDHPVTPLVLDSQDRFYLRRDHHNEQRILAGLAARLTPSDPGTNQELAPDTLREALEQLRLLDAASVPPADIDWQLCAVLAATARRFLLLTGGPGTGKTTTIARLLTVLLHLEPTLRVALAAPTGKAASRMGEALARQASANPRLAAALPSLEPKTLHRLLGYLPQDDLFRVGRDRPLPFDLVIVDEASMLDPALLAVLFDALPCNARLVLVGDRDQLAAVAAGQVLGDLCRAARPEAGVGSSIASYVAEVTGMRLPVQHDAAPIANAVISLQKNHRFGAQPGLDHFAQALARRDSQAALAALDAGHRDLSLATDPEQVLAVITETILAIVAATPEEALALLGSLRILAASRHGSRGTEAWNRRVEELLQHHGVRTADPWYRGRPVLITSNDPQNRLWNGDLGTAFRDERGQPHIAFLDGRGGVRTVSAFRVPAHETAWAMTVHKAQGSEFDTVVLSMPETESPLWQAPLLYTGITRARRSAILLADRDLLLRGLAHWPQRSSGLASGLAL